MRCIPSAELCRLANLRTLLLAGNPQRTVRAPVVQQGSAKVIEYLRNKSGVTQAALAPAPAPASSPSAIAPAPAVSFVPNGAYARGVRRSTEGGAAAMNSSTARALRAASSSACEANSEPILARFLRVVVATGPGAAVFVTGRGAGSWVMMPSAPRGCGAGGRGPSPLGVGGAMVMEHLAKPTATRGGSGAGARTLIVVAKADRGLATCVG